jgi:hypothetical protein
MPPFQRAGAPGGRIGTLLRGPPPAVLI